MSALVLAAALATVTPCVSDDPYFHPTHGPSWRHPTCTPTPTPIRAVVVGVAPDAHRLLRLVAEAPGTPGPEATCVAKGHEWASSTFRGMADNAEWFEASRTTRNLVRPDDGDKWHDDGPRIIRCRRCALWKEARGP